MMSSGFRWPTSSRSAARSRSPKRARSCSPSPGPWRSSTGSDSSTAPSPSTASAASPPRPARRRPRARSGSSNFRSFPTPMSCRRGRRSTRPKRWPNSARGPRSSPRSFSRADGSPPPPPMSTRWDACSMPSFPAPLQAGRGTRKRRSPKSPPAKGRRPFQPPRSLSRWRRSSPTSPPRAPPTGIRPLPRRPTRSPPASASRRCRAHSPSHAR